MWRAVQAASCGRGSEPFAARTHSSTHTLTLLQPNPKPQGSWLLRLLLPPRTPLGALSCGRTGVAQGRSGRSEDYRGRAMDGVSAIPSRALLQQQRQREEKLKSRTERNAAGPACQYYPAPLCAALRSRLETQVAAPASTCRQASDVGYVSSVERSTKPQPSSPSFVPLPVHAGRCQLACEARVRPSPSSRSPVALSAISSFPSIVDGPAAALPHPAALCAVLCCAVLCWASLR